MGSLPSPPLPPPPREQTRLPEYRVYAPFCTRAPSNHACGNWIECYNPSDNTWRGLGPIPVPAEDALLKGFAMVAVRDSIYIIGGRLCRKEVEAGDDDDQEGPREVDVAILPSVMRFSVTTEEWSQCTAMGTPRFDFACTVCDDKIYVAGGQCTLGGRARGVASAEVYDPMLDEWTALPKMRALRYKCVGVTWQGRIYVVGGFAEREDGGKTPLGFSWWERSSAEVYDTWRGEWDLLPGMWQLDVPPNQIVEVENQLYSSGDCLSAWKGHIEEYDGKQNIWNIMEGSQRQDDDMCGRLAAEFDRRLAYLSMVPIGSHLYFLAGYRLLRGSSSSISIVHAFDTSSPYAWRSMEPREDDEATNKELCAHCCVVQLP